MFQIKLDRTQGKLPYLPAGRYPVLVQRYLNGGLAESATAYINVAGPVISTMTPATGQTGTVFNLYGTNFGPYDASQTRVTIGGAVCALSLWNDTNIRGTVPSGLSGTTIVVVSRGAAQSNGIEFVLAARHAPSAFRTSTLNADFKLGEVYVYPNPAKGGKVPVFHVEVGVADSVKIKVFTVAGQAVHEHTITGSPAAIGGVYAYEYAWDGHIASGVYYYTVEAEKAGRKLKKAGKFAVVR
ncbi:MAG: IPT/TIG domain-containing protein [Elusimicrobiota bacterium]